MCRLCLMTAPTRLFCTDGVLFIRKCGSVLCGLFLGWQLSVIQSLHLYWELEPESSSSSSSSSSPPCGVTGSGPDRGSSAAPLLLWSPLWDFDLAVVAGRSFSFSSSESAEMSAVIPEQVRSEQGSRSGAEPEQPEAGVLQPQTVFVILDPAETLNVVRWVRKFFIFYFFYTPFYTPAAGRISWVKIYVINSQ